MQRNHRGELDRRSGMGGSRCQRQAFHFRRWPLTGSGLLWCKEILALCCRSLKEVSFGTPCASSVDMQAVIHQPDSAQGMADRKSRIPLGRGMKA